MASLPVLSGKEVVKIFQTFGWVLARQSSSHMIMTKTGEIATLSTKSQKRSEGNASKFDSLS